MVELRILGKLEITRTDGVSAESVLRQPKRFALLAYIASERSEHLRRETLLSLFWPDFEPSRARHALRQGLYFLKTRLGINVLDAGLGTALWCDAHEFEQLARAGRSEEAMRLYGGEFLADFEITGASPELSRWIQESRSRLTELASDSAHALSQLREEEGDLTGAVGWARSANRLDPLDETRARRLVELLDREGSRAAALSVYAGLYRRLQERYDLDPTSETLTAVSKVRERITARQSPARRHENDPPPGAAATAGTVTAAPTVPGPAEILSIGNGREGAPEPVTARRGAEEAKSGPIGQPPAPHRQWRARPGRRLLWGVTGAVLLAAGVTIALNSLQRPKASVSDTRVMVFPFAVNADANGQYLRRGLVSMLSAGLDGAGDLTATDPDAVLRKVDRRGDIWTSDNGSRVARSLGAGLFVLGSVNTVPGNHLRLNASLYSVEDPGPLARASVDGREDELLALINELTVELLAGRSPDGGSASSGQPLRSTSLLAWKRYLLGLEQLRAGSPEAALGSFRAALDEDSGFVRARYALSVASERALAAPQADAALIEVAERIDRLAPHERALTRGRFAILQGRAAEAESIFRRLTDEYPNDEEGWYGLGRVLMDLTPLNGRRSDEARRSLERAAELDPRHVDPRRRLSQLDLLAGNRASAARRAEDGLALRPEPGVAFELRALRSLDHERDDTLDVLILQADDGALFRIAQDLAVFDHSPMDAERVLRALDAPDRRPASRAQARLILADLELAQGRWSSARRQLVRAAEIAPLQAADRLALFSALPWLDPTPQELRRARSSVLDSAAVEVGLDDPAVRAALRGYLAGLLSLRLGERAEASRFKSGLDSLAVTIPVLGFFRAALAAAADEDPGRRLALLAGQSPEALPGELAISPFGSAPEVRYLRATAMVATGRSEAALDWLVPLGEQSIPDLVFAAPAHLQAARILNALGRRDEALAEYDAARSLWVSADAPLARIIRQRGIELGRD